jgi:site-specific DNA recombinase
MTSVLVYTRLSTDDLHAATDRQEAACRAYADARGWLVADVLTDTDASAYVGTRRPAFETLVEEAEVRSADGILIWKLDRLVRRPIDFERLWGVAERRNVFVASVTEPVDSSSPIGLALLRILVALAGMESATTGLRVRASKRQHAEAGRPPPVKAYGHTREWDALVPNEVAIISECAERAFAGERLNTIARDLQSRGVSAPGGGAWTGATMGRILRNPRLVGDRSYRGEVVARDCWPAIFDRDYFAKLQMVINHPNRLGAPVKHHKRMVTDWVVCGLCGHNMATTTRSGTRYYSCPTNPTGCGRVHVHADHLERWLLDRLLERLHLDAVPTPVDRDVAGIATAMAELCRDYYVDRLLGRNEFLAARALLVRRAEATSRASGRRPEIARVLAAADPRAKLGKLDLSIQRELVAARLERLIVNRFVDGHRRFDPARLRCEWREPALAKNPD